MLAGLLWGFGGLAGSRLAGLTGLNPLAVAAYRLLIGGTVATIALLPRVKRLPRTRSAVKRLVTAGALLAVYQTTYFGAVALTSVSLATLVTIGGVPVTVALVTAVRARRMPSPRTVVCVALAIAGLGLLAGSPSTKDAWATAAGVALCVLTSAVFATLLLVTRRPVAGLSSGATTGLGLLVGGLLLLPAALPLGMAIPLTGNVMLTALFFGTVPTALAYGAYFTGLRHANAVVAAVSAMLEPLTATVLSVVFLHEHLGPAGTAGAVLLGIALVVNYSAQSGSADGEPVLPARPRGAEVRA
ncbi:EamA family transporter [Kibdelosporangium lantanae]